MLTLYRGHLCLIIIILALAPFGKSPAFFSDNNDSSLQVHAKQSESKKMLSTAKLVILALFEFGALFAAELTATGGGVVKPGQAVDLVYNLPGGSQFSGCVWFWDSRQSVAEVLANDGSGGPGLGTVRPEGMTDVEYAGTGDVPCAIRVKEAQEAYNGQVSLNLKGNFLKTIHLSCDHIIFVLMRVP